MHPPPPPPLMFSDAFWATASSVSTKARTWRLVEATNPQRSDTLKLKHWKREDEADDVIRFQVPTQTIASYSDEEYVAHLQSPEWTKEETDHLFDLCRQFNLKFIVVADRYDIEGKVRTVEDLKERYYDVLGKLQIARSPVPLAQPVFKYDKERDIQRKKNLEALFNRPPEAIKEEEHLFHELKRRELHERKWACERDYLVKILSNHEVPNPLPLPIIPGAIAGGPFDPRKKVKRPDGIVPPDARKHRAPLLPQDSSSALAKKDLPPGAFLRSQKLVLPRASNLQSKFKELLDEFNLFNPPVFPTSAVCDVADEVRGNLLVLMDIKKSIERTEQEMVSLRERKRMLLAGEPVVPHRQNSSGMIDYMESGDEYDEAEARRRKKSGGFAAGGSVLKKARLH
ncbi:hypothetical protein BCR33DRAFT_307681 [Rhizoclosmatium globosum]|uniref:SWR1-complex protein 4 n=1 Tax=Rhizoclosmatium globosum TaxID=329046 RepID=A0A1Y2C5K1_9FUNG|nr:hypothetical protein BCR33DRAFT_307681 [Rhizoclosmatium globosum]|eukprot:ORY42320.1 hypothetical protein BCR33DRAFT_307681 [Rhizoclosmatium globosum]